MSVMVRALALASALLFAGTAEACWQVPSEPGLDRSRAAAEAHVDVQVALDDGHRPMFGCVTHGGHGAMGVHDIHAVRLNVGWLVEGRHGTPSRHATMAPVPFPPNPQSLVL
jgi:hypothetical protein